MKTMQTYPHNPLIAGAFFRSGQIEAWGRGIEKMKKGCIDDNLPEPEFKIMPTMFSICFRIRNNNEALANQKIYSADINGINGGINDTHQKIIDLMKNNPNITTQMIACELGVEFKNAESNIRALKKNGLIERIGSKKNGKWIVKI